MFEDAERAIVAEAGEHGSAVEFLVQGTLYPDVVESGGGTGTANIKSHHNVGGLPDDLQFTLVEPLRALFKDEVRQVGLELGPAAGDRVASSVPRSRPGDPHHRCRRRGAPGDPARGRRDRARGADGGRTGPRGLAVPGGAARRRALRGRAGRRPHLRPPGRAAPGVERGRHDRRLVAAALRPDRADLDPHHQRGARGQPRYRWTSPASRPAPSSGSDSSWSSCST